MSIRRINLITALILAVLILSVSALKIQQLTAERDAVQNMAFAAETASTLNEAIIELSLERSVMQVTLNLPDPIAPQFRGLIDGQRDLSEDGFARVTASLGGREDLRRSKEFLSEMSRLKRSIADIRHQADRLLSVSIEERDERALLKLPTEMKSLIEDFAQLPAKLRAEGVQVPTLVQTLETIQRRAWEVREYGGQERTYLAIATATGNQIPSTIRAEMSILHKRAVFALNALGVARDFGGLSGEIVGRIDDTRSFYAEDYDRVRGGIMSASDVGEEYPVTFADFFTLSSDALGRAVTLSGDAGGAIRFELDEITQDAGLELAAYWLMLAFAMGICGFQIYYTRNSVARRMDGIVEIMGRLSKGDTEVDTQPFTSRDEIGKMAVAVEVFRQGIAEKSKLEAEANRKDAEANAERQNALRELANRIENETRSAVETVRQQTGVLVTEINGMASISDSARSESESVAGSTQEAANTLSSVSESTQKLTLTISDLRARFDELADVAKGAASVADGTRQSINGLQDEVSKIDSVVKLISDIAEQTNLLALNATIEAVRAGEAGRGFAVVASEVKNLANQTTSATSDIRAIIEQTQVAVRTSVDSVKTLIDGVAEIGEIGLEVGEKSAQQDEETRLIAEVVSQSAGSIETVTTRIQGVAGKTDAAQQTALAVEGVAENLRSEVDSLKRTLISIVRSSSPEVERRRDPRVKAAVPVTCIIDGKTLTGVTKNIAAGGALISIEGVVGSNKSGTIRFQGVSESIPVKARAVKEGQIIVIFDQKYDVDALVSGRGQKKPIAAA